MCAYDVALNEEAAVRINAVLRHFLEESGVLDALLIDRSGQLLAQGGGERALDTVSLSALAAGAFSSTAAMARLLGEPEFTMMFHQGVQENIHVMAVDEQAILLALFDSRTTVGMVRLFAKDASAAIGAILTEARAQPHRTVALAMPLTTPSPAASAFRKRPVAPGPGR
jgi:predicted regulator of Ras-like GTPase activity (Roadblock/LC7/MglB family)